MGIYTDSNNDKKQAERAATELTAANSWGSQFPDLSTMDEKLHGLVNRVFDKDQWKSWGFGGSPDWEFFDNMKKGRYISGLKAYPVPSVSQYQQCQEGNGSGVWDENGWWRCLFPKANVTDPRELSQEDVENDSENRLGVFFKDYNSLLNWKSEVRKLIKEQELQKTAENEKETLNEIYAEYEKDVDWFDNDGTSTGIVSTSRASSYKTLPNGDAEEITEINNTFADGRSESKKFKKLIPRDGGSPIIEELKGKGSSNLSKWIWGDETKK